MQRGSIQAARAIRIAAMALVLTAAAGCGSSPTSPPPITQPPPIQPDPQPQPQPPPTAAPPVLNITRILAFGDSMTAGTTSAPLPLPGLTAGLPRSYPFKLQTLVTMRYNGQTIEVANAGL